MMINLDVDNVDFFHLDFHHLETLVHKLPNSHYHYYLSVSRDIPGLSLGWRTPVEAESLVQSSTEGGLTRLVTSHSIVTSSP